LREPKAEINEMILCRSSFEAYLQAGRGAPGLGAI
jgi:hypothetical protein